MDAIKDKATQLTNQVKYKAEDAKIGVQNKYEDAKDAVSNKSDDSKGAVTDSMKKYYRTNKFFFFLRILFVFANFAEILLGGLIVVFAFIGLLISPQLATIATRMITAGIGMVTQGIFAIAFSSLCFCCKGLNATCLRMTFLSSFTASFELLFFGGSYLFFEKGWINKAIVTGNKSFFFKLTLDHGGDVNTLVSTHFIFLRIAAVLCLIGFAVVVVCCFLSAFLLKPEYYLKQMPYIEHQIIAVCGSEFIFLGSFFKVLDVYSGSPGPILTTIIVIGSVIDWVFLVINIVRIFCAKWKPALQIIRIILVVIAGLASLACAIVILVKQKDYNNKAHDVILAQCLAGIAEQSQEEPQETDQSEEPEDPQSSNGYGGRWKDRILSKRDYDSIGNELKTSSLQQYVSEHLSSSFTNLPIQKQDENVGNEVSFVIPESDSDVRTKNEEEGADKCAKFIPNVERVYGCGLDNITITGKEEKCENTIATTVDLMSSFAEAVLKIMVFGFFMIVVYVILALILTQLSEYLFKIWYGLMEAGDDLVGGGEAAAEREKLKSQEDRKREQEQKEQEKQDRREQERQEREYQRQQQGQKKDDVDMDDIKVEQSADVDEGADDQ